MEVAGTIIISWAGLKSSFWADKEPTESF